MGASSLFLSVVLAAEAEPFRGPSSSWPFFGFLSSNLRTSSFSFCFADLRGAFLPLETVRMASSWRSSLKK